MKSELKKLDPEIRDAVLGAIEKNALDIVVMDIKETGAFTDYFLICTGKSSTQIQAICDEIERRLRLRGMRGIHIEGYNHADWVLIDCEGFVAHIFSQNSRVFYDLERLWPKAKRIDIESEPSPKATGPKSAGASTAD
jgi:ribosome-associated protein